MRTLEKTILVRLSKNDKQRWTAYVDSLQERGFYDASLSGLIRRAVDRYVERDQAAKERPNFAG
jgi:hypothetical protein